MPHAKKGSSVPANNQVIHFMGKAYGCFTQSKHPFFTDEDVHK